MITYTGAIDYASQIATHTMLRTHIDSHVSDLSTLESSDAAQDRAKMAARLEAYRDRLPGKQPDLIIPPAAGTRPTASPIPDIAASSLTAPLLHQSITRHGALIVRGLFPHNYGAVMQPAIDRVLDACTRASGGAEPLPGHYFNPPENLADIMPNRNRELRNTRKFHRDSGSAMCVEAPSVAETLLRHYTQLGIRDIVAQYLGEDPCLTAKKWVLRRSQLPVAEAGWHQDGAFMGTDINSLNMWVPLNQCGGDTGAPGMDVLPARLTSIATSEGAQFDWSVSTSQVSEQSSEQSWCSPRFETGDAFFFDHFFLHRTQYGKTFDRSRYAIETWFFGANRFPKNQIPLAW